MTSTRDSLINAIEKLGWHLTPESVDDFLKENKNLKPNDLTKIALDCDLRNIGAKYLPDFTSGLKIEILEGPCVLQLVKVRNIGAPKENENSQAAPPLYRLTLTDGVATCNALVVDEPNQKLNLNTPPGTKFLLKDSIKIKSNLLMLNNVNCQVLGGYVDYLVSKWKTNKELQQHVRVVNLATAPPPWVAFGMKQTIQVDTSKKVFAQNEKQAEDETSEFSQARQAALAEAMEAKLKITKTFAPQTIDKSQIKTEPEPIPAPVSAQPAASAKAGRKQGKGRKGRNLDRDDEDDYKEAKDAAKPSAVTLFDMVKNRLDIKEPEEVSEPLTVIDNSQRGGSGRGGRGGGRGGRNQGRNFSYRQQQQQQSQQPQQVYDKDDFSYDLGDETKVKDLVKIPKINAASHVNEHKTQQANQTQETAQSNNSQNYNSNNSNNRPRQENRQNSNNSQFNQPRNNYNNNQNNFNNSQPRSYQNNNNNMYQQDQQFNQPMNYYQNEVPNFNNNSNNQRPYQQSQQRQPKFINWRIGDECLARHPMDNKLYPVVIQNVNYNSNMCLVNFIGYNEYYEFYLQDLVAPNNQFNNNMNNNYNNNKSYNNNNNSNNYNNNRQNRRY